MEVGWVVSEWASSLVLFEFQKWKSRGYFWGRNLEIILGEMSKIGSSRERRTTFESRRWSFLPEGSSPDDQKLLVSRFAGEDEEDRCSVGSRRRKRERERGDAFLGLGRERENERGERVSGATATSAGVAGM